jgi:short subunit dehydrogenase-like uncharacterized protein
MPSLLLYGAQGYTGALVLSAAKCALDVVAGSRTVPPDAPDGWLALDLADGAALRRALEDHAAVLNCAGPFEHTWRPIVEACLDTGTHYLDLCAEWGVFEALRAEGERARERGVMLLPGVGFDVVASDCLALHVARRLPGARRLRIGISGLELFSRGSARTVLGLVGEPTRRRRGGAIVDDPTLREACFDFGKGPQPAFAVSWGDVSTAHHSTGIPDVAVFFEATPFAAALALANRSFGWFAKSAIGQRIARAQLAMLPPGPAPDLRAARRAVLVARVEDDAGGRAESRLVTPEAYTFTAASAVAVASRVLAGDARPGFQTPSALLGPDYVLRLPGVERQELP